MEADRAEGLQDTHFRAEIISARGRMLKRCRWLDRYPNEMLDAYQIYVKGNFIVALLFNDLGNVLSIGVAKKAPRDEFDLTRGVVIAYCRALRGLRGGFTRVLLGT